MSDRLLREYLKEVMLVELHVDRKFLAQLRRSSGLGYVVDDASGKPTDAMNRQALRIADEWISQAEDEIGMPLRHNHRAIVRRAVVRQWPDLLVRFRGNVGAAEQTVYNILDTKFNSFRVKVE